MAKRVIKVGQKYQEYKDGSKPFKVVRIQGAKIHTSRKTVINRSRLSGTKHYKLLGR